MKVRAKIGYYNSPVGRFWFAFNEKGIFAASLMDQVAFLAWLATRGVKVDPRPVDLGLVAEIVMFLGIFRPQLSWSYPGHRPRIAQA